MQKFLKKVKFRKELADYVCPIGGTIEPNAINTSFGPRINGNEWQFHRGMDLPRIDGASEFPVPVYAVHTGIVYHKGPKDLPKWGSFAKSTKDRTLL